MRLLHITTKKGKGFIPAEVDPVGYHAINKIEVPTKKHSKNESLSLVKPKKN